MSGLIGLINFLPDQIDTIGKNIKDQLCRFEWNTWDWWVSPDQHLALGRVDIGIFNPQTQPVISVDGQIVVLLSGELHNTESLFIDLENNGYFFERYDDPELVLKTYQFYELKILFIYPKTNSNYLIILSPYVHLQECKHINHRNIPRNGENNG